MRRNVLSNRAGSAFTIVELLIVIVIIAILASITIIAFNGTQQRAIQASLQADTDKARKKILLYHAENSTYPTAINCTNPTATEVCVQPSGTNVYTYSSNNTTNPATFYLNTSNGKYAYQASNTSGTEQAQTIVTDGLVLNIDAASRPSYPGTGTTWYDVSGRGNNGTLVNGVEFSATRGGSFIFDGVDDRVSLGNLSSFNFGMNDFTVDVFVYIDNSITVGNYASLVTKKGIAAANAGFSLYFKTDTGKFLWSTANGTNSMEIWSSNTFNSLKGKFAHVVMVRQGGSVNNGCFYVNGIYESISSGASIVDVSNSYDLTIGVGSNLSSNTLFKGQIPVVKIYNRALTPAEITQNFNALRGRYGI